MPRSGSRGRGSSVSGRSRCRRTATRSRWPVYAARAGMGSLIVMPVDAPEISRRECVVSGAELYLVDGLINHAGALVKAAVEERPGYQEVSTLKEPYRIEGKKTMGYGVRGAARLAGTRRDPLPGRWRGRADRDPQGDARDAGASAGSGRSCHGWSRCSRPVAHRSSTPSTQGSTRAPWSKAPTPSRSASTCPRRSVTSWSSRPCGSRTGRRSRSATTPSSRGARCPGRLGGRVDLPRGGGLHGRGPRPPGGRLDRGE